MRLALARRKARRAAERKQREEEGASESKRTEGGALGAPQITFSRAEAEDDAAVAGNVFAEDEDGSGAPGDDEKRVANPGFDEALFGDPEGLEHVPADDEGEAIKGEGAMVRESSKLSKVSGGPSLPKVLVLASRAPEVVHELSQGHYLKVFLKLAALAPPKMVGAAIVEAATKIGLGGAAKTAVDFLVRYGTEAQVLMALAKWTYEGFKQIHEAHERGDQETRIDLYADAFAHAFVYGDKGDHGQAALRAATPDEREAVELGRADGARSAGATGELAPIIGQALLEQYHSPDAVIHHIKSYLFKQAGLGSQAKARSGV